MSDDAPLLRLGRAARLERIRVEDSGAREFLGFVLGDESYGLPLGCIREILRVPPIAEVPRAPDDVLGVTSVRGQVTTLIDLRRKLKIPAAPIGSRTRILLVDQGDEVLGLLCDRVLQVFRLAESEVELAGVLGADTSSYVMGIGRPRSEQSGSRGRARAQAAQAARVEASLQDPHARQTRELRVSRDFLILLDPIALLKRSEHA